VAGGCVFTQVVRPTEPQADTSPRAFWINALAREPGTASLEDAVAVAGRRQPGGTMSDSSAT
jgi:hypothetical protein